VPQDRQGRFSTELFERYQRSEKALVAALAEMSVNGGEKMHRRGGARMRQSAR
jgi:transposase-like protein